MDVDGTELMEMTWKWHGNAMEMAWKGHGNGIQVCHGVPTLMLNAVLNVRPVSLSKLFVVAEGFIMDFAWLILVITCNNWFLDDNF